MLAWWVSKLLLVVGATARSTPHALLSGQSRSCRSGGKPTDYTYSGCFKVSKLHDEIKYAGARKVTPDGCFNFCQTKWKKVKGPQFFGVAGGSQCWCASLHEGTAMEKCKTPCAGDDKIMCGGTETASVYVMFDCTPPTPEEVAADKADKEQAILSAYAALMAGQSCGKADGNKLNVDGSPTFVGSVDDCKKKCYGSLECHGFTFEKDLERCTFHADVLDGKVTKKKGLSCYYKKLGLLSKVASRHGNLTTH